MIYESELPIPFLGLFKGVSGTVNTNTPPVLSGDQFVAHPKSFFALTLITIRSLATKVKLESRNTDMGTLQLQVEMVIELRPSH